MPSASLLFCCQNSNLASFSTNLKIVIKSFCFELSCPSGFQMTPDRRDCEDRNECLWQPCGHRGKCTNLDRGQTYLCECEQGFTCTNCTCDTYDPLREGRSISIGREAIAAIICCLLAYLSKYTFTYEFSSALNSCTFLQHSKILLR